MYKRHKSYFEETKTIGVNAWLNRNLMKAQVDVQRDINLFMARYSNQIAFLVRCSECSKAIRGPRYRCMCCIDLELCSNCYTSGKKPSEHLEPHEVIELRLVKVTTNFRKNSLVYLIYKPILPVKFKDTKVIVLVSFLLTSILVQCAGLLGISSVLLVKENKASEMLIRNRKELFLLIWQHKYFYS